MYFLRPACALLAGLFSLGASAQRVTVAPTPPTGPQVRVAYDQPFTSTGTTSFRFKSNKQLKTDNGFARQSGYYERDRDLGQTFTAPDDFTLGAITVRSGNNHGRGAGGSAVSIQFFEVIGTPVLHDNGTTTEASTASNVAWSRDPRTDDYLTGERYVSRRVVRGFCLPDSVGRQQYFRFELPGGIRLKKGRRYAFLLLFDNPGPDRAMSLATQYFGGYDGGHGIRRERTAEKPKPDDLADSTFPPFAERLRLPPGTIGYPDVDTYRDFTFYLESR